MTKLPPPDEPNRPNAEDAFLAGLDGRRALDADGAEMAEVWDAIGLLAIDDQPVRLARPVLADKHLWLAAAACLVAGTIGLGLWSQRPLTYATPVGGHMSVALADGSRVTLNTASAIEVRINGRQREVRLRAGEAYFEVVHRGDQAPFYVDAGQSRIRVTGTRFAVNLHANRQVDVDLLAGHIHAGPSSDTRVDGTEAVELSAGNGLVMDATGRVTARKPAAVRYVESWLEQRAYFADTPLSEAIAEMNRYRVHPLVLADPQKAGVRVSGVFDTANDTGFTKAVGALYGIRVSDGNGADQETH